LKLKWQDRYRLQFPTKGKKPHTNGINIPLDKRPLFPLSIFKFRLSIADWRRLGAIVGMMETKINRIIKEIELFSDFNSTPEKGVTRFSYSDADKEAKNYLIQQFESLDLEVSK
jgi:hypothetical protein